MMKKEDKPYVLNSLQWSLEGLSEIKVLYLIVMRQWRETQWDSQMTKKIIKLRETLNLIKANQPYTIRLKPMVINSGLLVLTNFLRINNSF